MSLRIWLLILLTTTVVEAQQYRFHQYRVEQGLPSDVIKGVTQDSLGFLWIATDDGVVKYDGIKFTTYKAALKSQYAKGFLRKRNGKVILFGDLDLIEIINQVDTVTFKTLLPGSRTPTDSTIWYPKSAYEDDQGNVWIGEPQSVVRFTGRKFNRYHFDDEDRSPVFIRSFSFFEDEKKILYVVSYKGQVFRFHPGTDKFVPLKGDLPEEINQAVFYQGKVLLATANGLYTAELHEEEVKEVKNIFPINEVSNLLVTQDSSVLVSTFGEDLYKVSLKDEFTWEALYYNFKGINSCYESNEGDVWAATDKGLVLVQRNLFIQPDINAHAQFIEGIASSEQGKEIYFCNKESIVKLTPTDTGEEWERDVIYENKSNYFRGLVYGVQGLWAASLSKVLLFENDKLKRQWDFSQDGNFIHDIFLDSHQNLWLSQAGNNTINVIANSLEVKKYAVPVLKQSEINLVREGIGGMFAAANGVEGYLFFKPTNENAFKNISLPINFQVEGDFNINDLAVQGNILWLASTEGLLRYDFHEITRVDLGDTFTKISVSAVEFLDSANILFANSHGLFRYNTRLNEFWLYDENAGLPSNTITTGEIFIDNRKRLWVGTSYGLAYAQHSIIDNKATAKPYCVSAQINGQPARFHQGLLSPYGAFINLQFSPITFPENKINLQWKFKDENLWHTLENRQLNLSNLREGEHQIFVRAKKNTGLGWSEPTIVRIIVEVPYWKRVDFIFLILLLIILIAWASYAISSKMMNQRREYLQNLIQERTEELQKANEELTLRNTELDRFVYSASHDLSAPLKSILGLVRVARMEEPGDVHTQYLDMMERSVLKLEEFIQEVVSYSRNARMPIKWEAIQFTDFVLSLLQDHQYSPNYANIHFQVEDCTQSSMYTDTTRIKIILNNLISNAIKFHWQESKHKPYVKISLSSTDNTYTLVVEDNGKGISENHLRRIFEMFYRATEDSQGSGLGLYILKEAVTKLGGKVVAESKVNEGTRFIVTLPVPFVETKKTAEILKK
jgi:signal transduction histidine kinase/ligand-binding sensor domain-containing protein